MIPIAQPSTVRRRMHQILDPAQDRRLSTRWQQSLVAALWVSALTTVAAATPTPVGQDTPSPTASSVSIEKAELYTRVFLVPPDFLSLAFTFGSHADGGSEKPTARDVLEQAGMAFPEGATASFKRNGLGSFLTVRNTAKELDRADQFVESVSPRLPKALRWRSHWTPGSAPPKR